ncbi:MAG: hypothetical protein KDA24_00715 [Deltaproteobacteria bacterium]|nr:hypothetical protein [Deltaproteobacteria bacterium]
MSKNRLLSLLASLVASFALLPGCADEGEVIDFDLPIGQSGMAMSTSGNGPRGLSVAATAGADTEVWAITRDWAEIEGEAGMAWGSGSGLNWEQKYSAWVQSMEETAIGSGSRKTFIITSPYGKSLAVPYLECAELAMAARVLFASWYGLPFYMQASSGGKALYAGHFGFRTADGRYKNSARYKVNYNDYSHLSQADIDSSWPVDNKLRGRAIYQGQDDNDFLAEGAKSGHYFDELLLNKRVGYFLLNLLPFFGSINIADPANAWDATAESVRAGDVLLKRWKKRGIGHVMLTKSVDTRASGKKTATLASGSMPRRQAVWESPAASKMLFTNQYTGGEGENYDGEKYVDLGGGLKRWPSPINDGGRWRNRVLPADMPTFLHRDRKDDIAARPGLFEDLLVTPSPEVLRDELLAVIESKRDWLRDHPSSCSARIAREDAWDVLYELMEDKFNQDKAETDLAYRELEDYVFAELRYDDSRTCCWNSTTRAMYDAAMDFNINRTNTEGECVDPLSFMMRDGEYADFSGHADTLGLPWVAWSADEGCPQEATVTTDTEEDHNWTPWCELEAMREGNEENPPAGADPYEANDRWQEAAVVAAGVHEGARITVNDRDWFRIDAPVGALVRFQIDFDHGAGDLDMEMFEGDEKVDSATGTSDQEIVDHTWDGSKPLLVKVIGYREAEGAYTITVTSEGGVDLGDPCDDNNEVMDDAFELGAGNYPGLAICTGDVDWFRIPATTGSFVARVNWAGNSGPFQVQLFRSNGEEAGTANSGNGWVEIESSAGLRFLQVRGIAGSTGEYTLAID